MNKELRNRAIKLRVKGEMSYGAIRDRLKVSKSTLSYWLRDFPLTKGRILELRRLGWEKGETSRERYRMTMREKRRLADQTVYKKYKKQFASISPDVFFAAGLMLYLGEGDKRNVSRVVFANTDPSVIKFFIKWLIEFLNVSRAAIRVQLHLYDDMDIPKEKNFWRGELVLMESQFYKIQIRKVGKNSFTYSGSYRHGTCSIFVPGVTVKREIMMAMKAFIDLYLI